MAEVPCEARSIDKREFILLLISLYRDRPELWKVKCKDYSNKNKRSLAYKYIVNVLKTYKPDFDKDKLKKKINVLRTNFNKAYHKIEQKKRSGESSDNIPEPTLWYYNEFIFIKGQLDVAESETSEPSLTEGSPQPPTSQAAPFTKKTDLAISYFKKSDNDMDLLAKGWAMKLNRVAPVQRRYAEKIINDTLFEAEMGTLTRNGVCFFTSSASVSPAHSIC